MNKNYKNFSVFAVLLALDQLVKAVVIHINPNIDLRILAIRLVKNTGATFGILNDFNNSLIWVSLIALGIIMMNYDKLPKKANLFTMFVTIGILGNLIDRIFRGFVVDFIDFKIWPVFNIADALITVGVIGLVFYVWKEK